MAELRQGEMLCGRYRLDRALGVGGMAAVWLANDEALGRRVAVKLIADIFSLDDQYVLRFRREAQIAAGLTHENLVRIYDYGTDHGRPFLVMEYVDGESLADLLGDGGGPDAVTLAGELLAALEHVHAGGIVHRDIKPANVLVGRDGRARLTDFGIARPANATQLTRTGHVVGTVRYLAPEVADGQPATPQSDLYALGILLRDVKPGPGALDTLIGRLTARQPAARPASAREARDFIGRPQRVQTTVPVPIRAWRTQVTTRIRARPTLALPLRRATALRHTRQRLAVIVVVLALLAGLGLLIFGGGTALRRVRASSRVALPSPSAPLSEQLRALERAIAKDQQH